MGWLGKVIGGSLGFAMGGPVGAIIGAGVGHLADDSDENGGGPFAVAGPELGVSYGFTDDGLGRRVRIDFISPMPDGTLCRVSFADEAGRPIKGRDYFCDEEGSFLTLCPVKDNTCHLYLPFGAMQYGLERELMMQVVALERLPDDGKVRSRGGTLIKVQIPAPPPWSMVAYLRPLIDICMVVVNADHKVVRAEVRAVKEYLTEAFELSPGQMAELKETMKAPSIPDIRAAVDSALFRVPWITAEDLLTLLAEVSKCDGEVHPGEVEVIRQAALAAGVEAVDWPSAASKLGLGPGAEQYAVLGLELGAPREEILAAYRKLVAEYHPDKVNHMAPEFQEVAHEKMTEINAAWETLKRAGMV